MMQSLFHFNEKKLHLSVVLQPNCQRQFFDGGDVIEGEIYLDVVSDGFKADCLKLLFCGGERTCTHWSTRSNKKTKHHRVHQRRDFVNVPMDIAYFDKNAGMPVQKKIFPFRFVLPNPLPPTIDRVNGNGGWAELTYKIYAFVATPGLVWNGEVSCEQEIRVAGATRNFLHHDPGPIMIEPDVISVSTCCLGKGNMALGGIVGKTVMDVSGDVSVRFVLGNNSTVPVDSVNVEFKATAHWYYGNHNNYSCWDVAFHNANKLEIKGASELSNEDRALNKVNADYHDVVNQLNAGQGYETILQYQGERPSYHGELFSLGHEIFIHAKTPWCSTNPEISTLVNISPSSSSSMSAVIEATPIVFSQVLDAERSGYVVDNLQDYSSARVFYGGSAIEESEDSATLNAPTAPPMDGFPAGTSMSLESLVAEMTNSVYDTTIVEKYIEEADKEAKFIRSLTANDISSILGCVYDVFARKHIAEMLFGSLARPIVMDDIIAALSQIDIASQRIELLKDHQGNCIDYSSPLSVERLAGILSPFERILLLDSS